MRPMNADLSCIGKDVSSVLSLGPEVQQQANLDVGGFEVIEDLRFGGFAQVTDRLDVDHDPTIDDEVSSELADQHSAKEDW